jgi:hypothetical protein
VRYHHALGARQWILGLGDGEKGSQVNLPQFLECALHGGDLFIERAIGGPQAREVLGHDRHSPSSALVDAPDVRLAHLAHPERLAPETSHAQVTSTFRQRGFEHVERGPQQHVDT